MEESCPRSVHTTESSILQCRPTKLRSLSYGKQEKINSFDVTGLYVPAHILLANSDELNLNLSKFPRSFYFLFSSCFLTLPKERFNLFLNCILVCNFSPQNVIVLDAGLENLDRCQYRLQPIKFAVLPSPSVAR